MATLKSNLQKVSGDTESLAKDYLKLFSVRQSEKIAIFLGVMMSIFVIATLVLILVIIASFFLAGALNKMLASEFWGFVIVGSLYLLAIILLIVKIFRTNTPLFTNLFVRFIVLVLELDMDNVNNIKGLKKEKELIKDKIKTDKTIIEADLQILRYNLMGSFFKEIMGLFTSKKKGKEEKVQKEDKDQEEDPSS